MFVRKSTYEAMESRFELAESERRYYSMSLEHKKLEVRDLNRVIDDLKAAVAAQAAQIEKLEAKDIKIVNEQSKQFIEVEHTSIKAMNATLPKLRKQGWSDKLKVKIQGDKVFTVHEREVKEEKK
ncbi:hypothetical protein TSARBOMBA_168 [Bacillus phage TsarBomba]|uniref:Uncharacterized protein n=1 Tax=Bacillus phage TsarBomba TaxID=1690456 RepID=A0A0K2D0K6_9CAUD|nr:hypothetical protein TSARBOMBA_168 [Bacillus phage TsarBomba]ALA13202.1 hypothetical protein TSARBOMBA_168 [Bacillus phage TsarBomba]